jgi:hypothetical protein
LDFFATQRDLTSYCILCILNVCGNGCLSQDLRVNVGWGLGSFSGLGSERKTGSTLGVMLLEDL